MIHLDITNDDFGPGFYNNTASTKDVSVQMNSISKEQLKRNKYSLIYGLRQSRVVVNEEKEEEKEEEEKMDGSHRHRRESGGFPFVDPNTFTGRLHKMYETHIRISSHIQEEIRSRDVALVKEKKRSEMLWGKLKNHQLTDEQAEMRRRREIVEMKNQHQENLESMSLRREQDLTAYVCFFSSLSFFLSSRPPFNHTHTHTYKGCARRCVQERRKILPI